MAVSKVLKDTTNYQMIAGLDENLEAQELKFHGDNVLVITRYADSNNEPIEDVFIKGTVLNATLQGILTELKIMNLHLQLITDEEIKDVN